MRSQVAKRPNPSNPLHISNIFQRYLGLTQTLRPRNEPPMLALLLIPALLGLALFIDTDDSADDIDTTEVEPETTDIPRTDPIGGDGLNITLETGNNTFDGSPFNDRAAGNEAANSLQGDAGNDFLQGFGGADTIDGGIGNDTVYAGEGDDTAVGGSGNDRVFLGDGNDLHLDVNDDTFDRGDDFVRAGRGDDQIADLHGSNALFGDAGDDAILAIGTADNITNPADTLDGGAGNDTLFGDNGDIMIGGEGDDTFAIVRPADITIDAVTIEDFNPTEDTFVAFVPEAGGPGDQIDLRFDTAQNAVVALWRGGEIAVLDGLTADDIPNIAVSIFDANDLLRSGLV